MKHVLLLLLLAAGCSSADDSSSHDAQSDAPPANDATTDSGGGDGGPSDAGSSPLALTCAPRPSPSACPAPSGASGQASFCFRAEWAGVTGVDVYVGVTGQASDWSAPFMSLTNDGTGTFTGTKALANGSYPYLFRVYGSSDGVVAKTQYLLDQENPAFTPAVLGAPLQRSMSLLTVPQPAPAALHHFRGKVNWAGAPQPCFAVALDVGEMLKDGGGVLSEHTTANFAETAADGTFDFPVADGQVEAIVRYPFGLVADAGYPDPTATPSIGVARTTTQMMGADIDLTSVDISYPAADYAAMQPRGDAALPITFTFTVVSGSTAAYASLASTNVAGNDPAWTSKAGTATSAQWDGYFNNDAAASPNTTYWWGTWQKRATWNEESLLFPISY